MLAAPVAVDGVDVWLDRDEEVLLLGDPRDPPQAERAGCLAGNRVDIRGVDVIDVLGNDDRHGVGTQLGGVVERLRRMSRVEVPPLPGRQVEALLLDRRWTSALEIGSSMSSVSGEPMSPEPAEARRR